MNKLQIYSFYELVNKLEISTNYFKIIFLINKRELRLICLY